MPAQKPDPLISDPAVVALRWDLLTPRQKQDLFDRFQLLTPDPGIPSYWHAPDDLQLRLDSAPHGHIDFRAPNEFLLACRVAEEFGTPVPSRLLDLINSTGPDGLLALLISVMEPYFFTGSPVPEGPLRRAWHGLFDWLEQPQIANPKSRTWDILIVPGNRSDLKHRVDAAADLRDCHGAKHATMVLSGAHPRYEMRPTSAIGEAEAMAWYLEQLCPDHAYAPVIDSRARTTEETMYNSIGHIRVAQRARLDAGHTTPPRIAVVTSPYHVRRAHLLANRIVADDRLKITDEVHVVASLPHFSGALILDGEPEHRDRHYAAVVLLQEMLKIPGGRGAGVF